MPARDPDTLQQLTRDHFQAAAEAWNAGRRAASLRSSTDWTVEIGGSWYPTKAITGVAHELAGFGELTRATLAGDAARRRLKALGFELERRLSKDAVKADHVEAAARDLLAAGQTEAYEFRGNRWLVQVGDHWYGYRNLVRRAAHWAGLPEIRDMNLTEPQGGRWRDRLRELGFRLSDEEREGQPIAPLTEATADDLTADAVRAAAAAWDAKDSAFQQAHASTGYNVWIDGEPYPPKSIGVLASESLGLAPPTGYGYGTMNGPWYPKLAALGFPVLPKGEAPEGNGQRESRTAADVEELKADPSLDATTKQRLVDARLGQGRFRSQLEGHWDAACAVTGVRVRAILRASHIQPWAASDNEERLDPHNGLLLVANLDALFDRGLISFTDDGTLLIGKGLPDDAVRELGLTQLRLRDSAKGDAARRAAFLRRHRAKYSYDDATSA
ncbi:HNH endonuclease [Cupriavidus sp. PET2-C1]